MKIDVEVDNGICSGPLNCGKCLQVCPTAAFRTYPSRARKKGELVEKWLLDCMPWECVGCEKCRELCPVGAIKIVVS